MALIPIRVDRTSKPPIGTPLRTDGHWSVQGLVCASIIDDGSLGIDLVSGVISKASTGITLPDGYEGSGASTSSFNFGARASNELSGDFTFIGNIKLLANTTGTTMRVITKGNDYDPTRELTIGGEYPSNIVTCRVGYSTTHANTYSNYEIPVGLEVVVAGVYSESSKTCKIYCKGKDVSTYVVQGVGSKLSDLSAPMRVSGIGNTVVSYPMRPGSRVSLALAYALALTPAQIQSISENPWQIFEPETILISAGPSPTIDQHSFRFFADDGSEIGSTALAALNTNLTLSPGDIFRLRGLLDATGNPLAKQIQIEYRRKPSGGSWGDWKKVN